MKRNLLLLLMALVCMPFYAQTYCYKLVSTVDKQTGVKSKATTEYVYLTFQNGKSSCYFSDEDGNSSKASSGLNTSFGVSTGTKYEGENYYTYQGVDNGRYVYLKVVTTYTYIPANYYAGERGGYYPMSQKKEYLYFSQSYDRINQWTDPKSYLVKSSGGESQLVSAARSGWAMGSSYGNSTNSTIYVYEKTTSPTEQTDNPTMMY